MNASAKWNAVCRESWEKARATLLENDVPGGAMGRAKRLAWRDGGERGRSKASGQANRGARRSEEHTSELQSRLHLVCRLLLEKKKKKKLQTTHATQKN